MFFCLRDRICRNNNQSKRNETKLLFIAQRTRRKKGRQRQTDRQKERKSATRKEQSARGFR